MQQQITLSNTLIPLTHIPTLSVLKLTLSIYLEIIPRVFQQIHSPGIKKIFARTFAKSRSNSRRSNTMKYTNKQSISREFRVDVSFAIELYSIRIDLFNSPSNSLSRPGGLSFFSSPFASIHDCGALMSVIMKTDSLTLPQTMELHNCAGWPFLVSFEALLMDLRYFCVLASARFDFADST